MPQEAFVERLVSSQKKKEGCAGEISSRAWVQIPVAFYVKKYNIVFAL